MYFSAGNLFIQLCTYASYACKYVCFVVCVYICSIHPLQIPVLPPPLPLPLSLPLPPSPSPSPLRCAVEA